MGFVEAIRTCVARSFVWDDRAGRAEFWWFSLLAFLAYLMTSLIGYASPRLGTVLTIVVVLALCLPSTAVTIRRLHDTNRSGGWYWLSVIPLFGTLVLFVFLVQRGTDGPNRYGAPDGWAGTSDVAKASQARPQLTLAPGKHWCENISCHLYRISANTESCTECGHPTMQLP